MTNDDAQLAKLTAKQEAARAAAAEADAAVADYIATVRIAKIAEMQKVIADYSFTVAELFGTASKAKPKPHAKARGKRAPAVPKYRDEHGNTWGGGKGPRPAWVKAIQAAGGDLEKYQIGSTPAATSAAAERLVAQGGAAPAMEDVPRRRSAKTA